MRAFKYVIGLMVFLVLISVQTEAVYAWWNTSYTNRVLVTTNYNSSSNTINPILLNGTAGLNVTTFIDDYNMQDNCGDLRLIADDDATLINFEYVNGTCGDSTEIWFAPSLNTTNLTFYVYFNSSATEIAGSGKIWEQNLSLVYHFGTTPKENNTQGSEDITVNLIENGHVPFNPDINKYIGSSRIWNGTISPYGFTSGSLINYIQAENMSIEAWVNLSGASNAGEHYVLGYANAGGEDIKISVTNTGAVRCLIRAGGDSSITGSAIQLNVFNQIVCEVNGTHTNLYINGTLDSFNARVGTFTEDSNVLSVGVNRNNDSAWNGTIDDIQIWNYTKSSSQILESWNNRLNNRAFMDLSAIETYKAADTTNLTNCTGATAFAALNFTLDDEASLNSNVYGDLEIAFTEVWENNQSEAVNFSFGYINQSSFLVCVNPGYESYNVTATLLYKNIHTGDNKYDMRQRTYYLVNRSVNNVTQNISLYSVGNDTSDLITFSLTDATNLPEADVYVHVLKHYLDEDIFRTVTIMKSDFQGNALTYLTLYDVFYKFALYQNGFLLEEISPTQLTETTINIQLDPAELGDVYNVYGDVAVNCSYHSTTFDFTCSGTDVKGEERQFCLVIDEIVRLGDINLYNGCSTGSSVTITHNVGNATGRLLYYDFKVSGSDNVLESGYLQGTLSANEYGLIGLLVGVFFILFMGFIGRGPSIAIINTIIAVALMSSAAFGFINIEMIGVVGLALAGAFIVFVIRN